MKPRILHSRFSPNFHQIVATGGDNKNVTSADLESVGQDHHLQKSLNLGIYTADFNQIFNKMLQLVLITNVSHQLTLTVYVKVTIYKNYETSDNIQPILTKFSPKCYWC